MKAETHRQIVALLPRLRRFARALAGSSDDADDLVQNACERALRGLDRWEPGTRLDSWMFRILRNLWIDSLRRKRIEGSPEGDVDLDVWGEDGRRTAEARLDLARVRERIQSLPHEQRDVLALVCIEDMSYREAAAILDIPIGTVMSRLSRARRSLAVDLGEAESENSPARRGSKARRNAE